MKGGGWWGTIKWQVNPLSKLKTAKWYQLVVFSAPHNIKWLNPWPTSPASHVVIYSWMTVQGDEAHPSTHGHLTSLRIK